MTDQNEGLVSAGILMVGGTALICVGINLLLGLGAAVFTAGLCILFLGITVAIINS